MYPPNRMHIRVGAVALAALFVVSVAALPAEAGPKKREKNVDAFPVVDLSRYDRLVVPDFTASDAKAERNQKSATKMKLAATQIPDFLVAAVDDGLFGVVSRDGDSSAPGTLVLEGEIVRFKPGSAAARSMLAGAGRAQLDSIVRLVDGATGEVIVSFPVDKTWAWGGAVGMSKGIGDLAENFAVELAMYLERCKAS